MLASSSARAGEVEGQHGIIELAYTLLASLPRSRLAVLQARIAPLLKLDIVGVSTFNRGFNDVTLLCSELSGAGVNVFVVPSGAVCVDACVSFATFHEVWQG